MGKRTLPFGRRLLALYSGMAHGARAALELLDDELAAATSVARWDAGIENNDGSHMEIVEDIMAHIGRAIGEVDAITRRLGDLAELFSEGS